MGYVFLASPWRAEFARIVGRARRDLFVCSPFVDQEGVKVLTDAVARREGIRLLMITSITTRNVVSGATDVGALVSLYGSFRRVQVASLGRVHAKVYLVDDDVAVITSANLTGGGLVGNFEYGVALDDKEVIATIRHDMLRYLTLGNVLDVALLGRLADEQANIRRIQAAASKPLDNSTAGLRLSEATEAVETELLSNRVKEGRTINAIFSDTIVHILEQRGGLSTRGLNPLVQMIHPDICDDSIDRVINGEHFGKKWKHSVRGAQVCLNRAGIIELSQGKWHLTGVSAQ